MPIRQSILRYGLTLAAGILFTAAALHPQAPGGGPGWHYCSVYNSTRPGSAEICYAVAGGCKYETVNPGGERSSSMMLAAQKLGDQGWELVAAGGGDHEILYFKRLKALDNQHPLGN